MSNITNYSEIISPIEYNKIMNEEHLYISTSDDIIKEIIKKLSKNSKKEVVEIGCGPGRFSSKISLIKNISLSAIDIDLIFLEFAKKFDLTTNFIQSEIQEYRHTQKVDIFISQGLHHHIDKGKVTQKYLLNVFSQLNDNGVYILSDEFLPEYTSEKERNILSILWYSHIIASAKDSNYLYLAQEEAKTLLDDLFIQTKQHKNESHLTLILESAITINNLILCNEINKAKDLAISLLEDIHRNSDFSIDLSLLKSRGDFKICESVLKNEINLAGFEIKEKYRVGPEQDIGGMIVYILGKK